MLGLTRGKNRVRAVWAGAVADHVIDLGWSTDGRFLAAAASTGPVAVLDAKAGTGDVRLAGHANGTLALGWSPRDSLLATAGKDRRVRLWEPTGREVACLEAAAAWVERLAWHPDGSKLAAAGGRTVHLWTGRGEHLADLADHPSTVSDLAWKPGADTLSALIYGGVMHWTLAGAGPPTFRLFPWKGSPLRLAWSPNAAMLAHGNQDATVHFWYAETAEELQMSGYATKVRELSWNTTSRYLATGGGSAVCVWDCGEAGPSGSKPLMLDGHAEESTLSAVVFQRRGHLLASGGTDGRVCVWQPQNKKQPLVGAVNGDDEVTVLRWSPDEKLLGVGFGSGAVSVLSVS
jgi:WD40 repeat protein